MILFTQFTRPQSLKNILRMNVGNPTRTTPSTGAETSFLVNERKMVDPLEDNERMRPDDPGFSTAPFADRSLVVLDPEAPSTSLRSAIEHLPVSDGELHLLVVFPTEEYEARRRARLQAGVTTPYTIDHLEAEAQRMAQQAGREWLDPACVAFEPIGAVGRLSDSVQTAVEDSGSTHIYVPATKHTHWQRLLGVEGLSTALARVLPPVVSIVTVDGMADSASIVVDGTSVADLPVDTGAC